MNAVKIWSLISKIFQSINNHAMTYFIESKYHRLCSTDKAVQWALSAFY